ncbi:MAG: NADH-quinone oxidoreductase subunit L [Acidimicrobiales bacterium]
MTLGSLLLLATEAGEVTAGFTFAGPWILRNAWIVPFIPAMSFLAILFFGKRLPYKGAEIGVASVLTCLLLAIIANVAWFDHRDNFEAHGDRAEDAAALVVRDVGSAAPAVVTVDGVPDEVDLTTSEEEHEAEGEGGHEAVHPSTAVRNEATWFQTGGVDFKVGTLIDGQAVMMLFVVSLISLLVHVYSTDYVAGDRRYTHYFAFLSLFTAAMLLLVVSATTIMFLTAWELVGVCSFALIGHWWEEKPNSDAALKAFLTNRVGDVGLLIGIIILFFAAGQTFDIVEINTQAVNGQIGHNTLLIASLCLMAAVMSKSGQFVLHTWLPDAMAGPTPVSALIHAATMVVAGIYMIARLYGVFFEGFSIGGSSINAMAVIGTITLFFGGLLAFVQDDIKKVLAYSTVSQLGYMVMALGVGAWGAALFHLFTHAFFKAGLFLGAGSVSHAVHSFDMKKDMGGMRKFMPKTFATFMICTAALVGVFPFAGFWSKDEILVGTGGWGLFGGTGGNGAYTLMLVGGIAGAALTGAYMTRVIYLTFYGEFRHVAHNDHAHHSAVDEPEPALVAAMSDTTTGAHDVVEHADTAPVSDHGDGDEHKLPHESGPRITVPLIILATFALLAGLVNLPPGFLTGDEAGWQERFLHFYEPAGAAYFPAISHGAPSYSLAIFSSIIGLLGVAVAYYYYFVLVERKSAEVGESLTELPDGLTTKFGFLRAGHKVLVEKYYLDHLYTGIIAGGTKGPVAKATNWFNQHVLDEAVDVVGRSSVTLGEGVYKHFDQKVVDGAVNTTGLISNEVGSELRKLQNGKIQQYAAYLFAGATVLAGVLVFVI